jgi:hypothetical protein
LGRGGIIATLTTTEIASGLGFHAEVGLDDLLASGVLGGDVQELPHRAWGLAAEHVDKRLTGHVIDEGVDHVSIDDVRELIVLLGEALNVLSKGLISPLPIVVEVPGVAWAGVGTLEVADEDRTDIALVVDAARVKLLEPSSSQA